MSGQLDPMAAALAPAVDWWRAILVEHVANDGGLCSAKVCRRDGRPHLPHPCAVRLLAQRARAIHDGDDR